ncbi:MBG domain-containing protein [Pontibacter sp. 13R65]|uniref:MBG domain-containing protein n=1 Tax=Pontibacter sp. 13R65 TaxID=3127458 RepID=UPI00301DA819
MTKKITSVNYLTTSWIQFFWLLIAIFTSPGALWAHSLKLPEQPAEYLQDGKKPYPELHDFFDYDQPFESSPVRLTASSNSSGLITYTLLPGGTGEARLSGTNNQMLQTIKQGTVLLRATIAEDFRYRQAYRDIIVTIVKGTQTISFPAIPDKTIGVAPFDVAATGGGSGNPVVFAVKSGPATISGKKVTITGVGKVTIRATQAGNTNFEAAQAVERSFEVKKAVPVLTFNDLTKTYGDNAFNLAATANVEGTITYSIVAGGTGEVRLSGAGNRTVTIEKAGTVKIKATLAEQPNYQSVSKEAELVIRKAAATVTLGSLSQTYTGLPRAVTVTTAPAGLSNSITYGGNTTAPVNAGTYAIVATITDQNYTGQASGSLVVRKAGQQITFPAIESKQYGDESFQLESASTGGDEPVRYSVVSGPATVAGSTLTITGAGTIKIRATKAGDANHNAAQAVEQSFSVSKKELQVKAEDQQRVYKEVNPVFTLTYTGFVNNDKASDLAKLPQAATTATVNSAVGTYPITVAGGEDANYTFTFVPGVLTVTKATATIALTELEQPFNGKPIAVTYATTPAGLPVAVTYNGAAAAPVAVGEYAVVAVIEDPNYSGEATGTLKIMEPTSVAGNISSKPEVKLYPNPTSNGQVFVSGLAEGQPVQVQVHDISGRMVWQARLQVNAAGELLLPFSQQLQPGQYVVQITGNKNVRQVLKLVKE